jgi:hypothetical protein
MFLRALSFPNKSRRIAGQAGIRRFAGILLSLSLTVGSVAGQPPAVKPSRVDLGSISGRLQIFVLKGRDEVHLTSDQSQKFIVVEIRDDNNLPVEGAEVTFELPASGPGGLFRENQTKITTRTTGQGQAAAAFTPNQQMGRYQIGVKASIGERAGTLSVNQMIAARADKDTAKGKGGFFSKKTIILLSLAGAGAVTGIVLATRGDSASASTPPITINPGAPSFGGPR